MAATTTMMQQLLQEFAENLGNTFDGIHQQLVNLNTRLQDLEEGRIRGEAIASVQASLDREVAIDDLTTETKNVMIAAGKSFLNSKLEEPQSSNTTKIITTVRDTLLPTPEAQLCPDSSTQEKPPVNSSSASTTTPLALQLPLLPCPHQFGHYLVTPVAAKPPPTDDQLHHPATWPLTQQAPPLPPQQPAPLVPASTPPEDPVQIAAPPLVRQQPTIMARLTPPTFDGTTYPLPWVSRMQHLFQLQNTPARHQVRYATFHLSDTAHRWYMQMTMETPTTEWTAFAQRLIQDFSSPTDLTPPRHNNDLNNYIDTFTAYTVRTSITDQLQQVHLFVDGLQHKLRDAVRLYQPQEMEATTLLACDLDDRATTPLVAPQPVESMTPPRSRRHSYPSST
jgi:hypothetical protein